MFDLKNPDCKSSEHSYDVPMKSMIRMFLLLLVCFSASCSYVVDVFRFAAQEDYVHGKEALYRTQTAAAIGFGIKYTNDRNNANLLAPVLSALAARIKEDRDYLESSVKSCEDILITSNGLGLDLYNQMIAGVFCNMGPGKRPDQL